jgi:hypothetical protein
LFPFQVSSHADLHFMRFDESEFSNVLLSCFGFFRFSGVG